MDFATIFQSQRDFFYSHQTKNVAFRKQTLSKLKNILKTNEERLYKAIYKDFRKGRFDTFLTELNLIYNEIDFFLNNLDQLSRPDKVKTALSLQPGKSHIYYDPLGVTLIIGAWNYPYQLTLSPMVSAIAAGNTCMIKPSELPENTMHLLAELINNNFPSDYVYVAEGGIPETTELLELRFDKIFFTGSPKVGKIVYEAAAKNLVPVTLELGGKSPAVVTGTADLEVAAKRLVWGKFLNGGQTCIAPDYLLVEESVKPQLLQLMKEKLDEINYSDGAEHYTSIINKRNFDRVLGLIDETKIIYGGNYNSTTLYIEPTVMDNVSREDPVMQEEIFGPVFPVISYTDYDDMLNGIIEGEKPLAAYLFTKKEDEKDKFLEKVSFGGGCINDTLMHITSDYLPFGGIGNSGIGNYHGEFGFLTFSHQKSVIEKMNWGEPDWKYPPYSDKKMHWLKKVM
ncbi:aldehyde dehydrogenase family protein [Chryseobacterium arthrosphaerae]|uniref:aldehyde dehydrogenase family protein n=1 Tax=Chryseobacterium arthrosphaerae TaxID=651561 RepID=UPI001BAE8F63|nr:aldehyde dehydrogenase family protein [Chryseobacterium arthrosphaerae]QUY53744.1 aldehyde dehydrogenase family protein [Chryseobacterium arthrosphaerae]